MSDMIDRNAAIALPPYDGDGDPAGQFDHHIFVKLADLRALPAVDVGVKPLDGIAKQKRTDELETEYDVEVADFEGGYDACIDRARAALTEIKETDHE